MKHDFDFGQLSLYLLGLAIFMIAINPTSVAAVVVVVMASLFQALHMFMSLKQK